MWCTNRKPSRENQCGARSLGAVMSTQCLSQSDEALFACLSKCKLNILSETFIKQLPNGDKLKKHQEHPVTD